MMKKSAPVPTITDRERQEHHEMSLPSFETLYQQADVSRPRVPVVAAGGADVTVLRALHEASQRGWVAPCVTGNRTEIERTAAECAVALDGFSILDTEQPATAAVAEVRAGRAEFLMKGQISTPELMKSVLHQELGLRTGRTLCQIVLMEVVPHSRRFLLSDTGLCISPDFRQKREILEGMVRLSHQLGTERPRVAVMSATEKVTSAMPDTEEAFELQQLGAAGALGACDVQGPLSFDLAYASEAGDKKQLAGPVVGEADALLFPDLLSGNLTVKAIMYTADCRFGGVVWGARVPIVFMSRADRVETRLNSLAYTIATREAWRGA